MNNKMNRRKFLVKSEAGILSYVFLPPYLKKFAPSDRVRVAHNGVGGMGNNHMQWFSKLSEAEIVALCDVDKTYLNKSLKSLSSLQPGKKVKGYHDFRHILDMKDIDVITCATPDH